MKYLFLICLMIFSGKIYGQNTIAEDGNNGEPSKKRAVILCVEANSGHLIKNQNRYPGSEYLFSENETEFGITYKERLLSWLSLSASISTSTGINYAYNNSGNIQGTSGVSFIKFPNFSLGLNFADAFEVSMDTTGFVEQTLSYYLPLGERQYLFFMQILQFYAVPQHFDYLTKAHIVDFFIMNVSYGAYLTPKFEYSTTLEFAFMGNESAEDFRQSFGIRWDNKFSYQAHNQLNIWGKVRYEARNVIHKLEAVDHVVQLLAGITYNFEF